MFYYLKGFLREKKANYLVLEAGGIGYQVHIPASLYPELPAVGEELTLFTHLYVREDGLTLYGFSRPEVRDLFTLVLGVAGIGPRVALNVVGTFSPFEFTQAVLTEDHALLTRVPGIGPKTARRLVLELKEKLRSLAPEFIGDEVTPGKDTSLQEAVGALLVLGYTPQEAQAAVRTVASPGDQLEGLVKKALQYLGER